MIAQFRHFATAAVRGKQRAAQVIAKQVGRRVAADAHRHPLTIRVVVFRFRTGAGAFEVVADVVSGHAVQHGFHAATGAEDRATQECDPSVTLRTSSERRSGDGATGSGRNRPDPQLYLWVALSGMR